MSLKFEIVKEAISKKKNSNQIHIWKQAKSMLRNKEIHNLLGAT